MCRDLSAAALGVAVGLWWSGHSPAWVVAAQAALWLVARAVEAARV